MKTIIKRHKILFFAVILFCLCIRVQFGYAQRNFEYYIYSYDFNILVHENNTFEVTEKIQTHFFWPKHGIVRTIPLRNKVVRLDGTTSYNRAKVSEIQVNEKFFTTTKNGHEVITIGDELVTLTGGKTYTIKYLYDLGNDPGKGYDEFYFNLVGNDWDTYICNITFTITMPKEFDEEKLGFSSGKLGSTNSANVYYEVLEGNVIRGHYLGGSLESGEALTVRLELPEGYFTADYTADLILLSAQIVSILLVVVIFLIWRKHGKDNPVIETVEFYPPEGLNSADISFLYKGKADSKGIISLLIYLANKGYLQIEEEVSEILFIKNRKIKLVKLKDYDGDNKIERDFLEGLFKNNTTVTVSDLKNNFYKTLNALMSELNSKKNREIVFDKFSLKLLVVVVFMMGIIYLLTVTLPVYVLTGSIGLSPELKAEPLYVRTYIIGFICNFAMLCFYQIMPKRTHYGNEMLGRIRGFKNFLETAEKPKLEALVLEDATYFYHILPYTYVLGVSDKWIKKFESIALQAPDWYRGNSSFNNLRTIDHFMDTTLNTVSQSMTASPKHSGGGSAGRGSGGGGGRSW